MALAWAGQINIATSGTEVQGTDTGKLAGYYAIKGHPNNTGAVFIGDNADVSETTGYPLDPGQDIVMWLSNLNQLWFDTETGGNGNDVCWLYLGQSPR